MNCLNSFEFMDTSFGMLLENKGVFECLNSFI